DPADASVAGGNTKGVDALAGPWTVDRTSARKSTADRNQRGRVLRPVHASRHLLVRDVSPERRAVLAEHRGPWMALRGVSLWRRRTPVCGPLDRRARTSRNACVQYDGRHERRFPDAHAVAARNYRGARVRRNRGVRGPGNGE